MGRKPKLRSKKVGGYGYTVHVYEREPDGILYIRRYDPKTENWRARSLGHRDWDRAVEQAKEVAGELLAQRREASEGRVTMRLLFREYLKHQTPNKVKSERDADRRRVRMWTAVLGASLEPLEAKNWKGILDGFVRDRRAGRVKGFPRTVKARTVQADLVFLQSVFNWASDLMGPQLISHNPIRGYKHDDARELNPHKPRASETRYLRTKKYAHKVSNPLFPSYLTLLHELGWRGGAICGLQASDFDFEPAKNWPHGRVKKQADIDKEGAEAWAPMTVAARHAALEAIRITGAVGQAWLFPAVRKKGAPWSTDYAYRRLLEAQELAGYSRDAEREADRTMGLHAYRRKWATERLKAAHSREAVRQAGDWRSLKSLDSYDVPDDEQRLEVVRRRRKVD